MKQKLLLFAALMFGLSVYAENLVIQTMTQQEKRQALETFGRLEFDHSQQQMLLILKDGSVAGVHWHAMSGNIYSNCVRTQIIWQRRPE